MNITQARSFSGLRASCGREVEGGAEMGRNSTAVLKRALPFTSPASTGQGAAVTILPRCFRKGLEMNMKRPRSFSGLRASCGREVEGGAEMGRNSTAVLKRALPFTSPASTGQGAAVTILSRSFRTGL